MILRRVARSSYRGSLLQCRTGARWGVTSCLNVTGSGYTTVSTAAAVHEFQMLVTMLQSSMVFPLAWLSAPRQQYSVSAATDDHLLIRGFSRDSVNKESEGRPAHMEDCRQPFTKHRFEAAP